VSTLVECRSDHDYAQRPVALTWQGQRMEVIQVINTWRSPLGKHFQVLTGNQSIFTLVYQEADDQWSIELSELPTNSISNKENS
jgi:hypothetical protein